MEGRRLLLAIVMVIAVTGSFVTGSLERHALGSTSWSTVAHVGKLVESSLVAAPADFYCVLVMKTLEELECYFEAWPGTHWNLSYFTNAISGSVEFSCVTQHCGVNVTGAAQRITTYNFTLRNLSAQSTDPFASVSRHAVYSDDYITRLRPPENVLLQPGRTHLLVTWTPPLSVYGVLKFALEALTELYGLEHEISYRETESRASHSEVMRLSSSNMNISANITHLRPFTVYEIQIRSRVKGSAFDHTWSPATTASVTTLEAPPAVAPEVFRDGFHLMKCNDSQCIAKIYWKGIQETSGKSNGKLSGYVVTLDTNAQKLKLNAARPPLVVMLNMTYSSQLFIQGETRDGTGPPSDMIRIPSLANVITLDPCAMHADEMNATTVEFTWSLRQQSEREDSALVRVHWCYIVQSECAEISTAPETYSTTGKAFIIVDKPPIGRYRFGVSALGSSERSSGIVWSDCTERSLVAVGAATMPTQSSGLTGGAIVGIVMGITVAVIAVALLSWRLKKGANSIQRIPHIPKTHQTAEVHLKPDSYKYDTVLSVCEFSPLTNSGCGWKAENYIVAAQKERNAHIQQSVLILASSQEFRTEANFGGIRALESGNCLKERESESSDLNGYTVTFRDLIDQAREAESPNALDSMLLPGFDMREESAGDGASTFLDSWSPSVLSEDRDDQPRDAKGSGEQKLFSSPPTSSDYVMATCGEQQS